MMWRLARAIFLQMVQQLQLAELRNVPQVIETLTIRHQHDHTEQLSPATSAHDNSHAVAQQHGRPQLVIIHHGRNMRETL
jgi:hypothetical protein